ncbi:hypothetical protein CERSUDRAFT_77170 [Gelatoporia subvermispora B]|uniref:F-box domain-containing protein n=1 Tax=Ceriporiopsis subvermispora (strain B) TaxID=914234 RepID=M2R3I7_CERS8|nr:hypothetical protein CERSUDRAFT_77170 [Gelatoporia subvermispora B]
MSAFTEETCNSSFPPETVDNIVDQLRNDSSTLRNCRLVNRTWAARTRFWLSKRTVRPVTADHHTTFSNSKDINSKALMSVSLEKLEVHVSSQRDADAFGRITSLPNTIKVLRMSGLLSSINPKSLANLTSVKRLHLDDATFPNRTRLASFLGKFGHIEELSLHSLRCDEDTSIAPPRNTTELPYLRRLVINDMQVSLLTQTIRLRTPLESLNIAVDLEAEIPDLRHLFTETVHIVKSLTLETKHSGDMTLWADVLRYCTSMQTLTIICHDPPNFGWLDFTLFEVAANSPRLQRINIGFYIIQIAADPKLLRLESALEYRQIRP